MKSLLPRVDDVLRRRRWAADNHSPTRTILTLTGLLVFCGALYGAALGTFGGITPDRFEQILYSAIKIPLLLLATFAISLPSFYVLNMLFGVGDDFRSAVRALVATQAGIAIVLASLAPYTLLWYLSTSAYNGGILFNAFLFTIATSTGQWMLRQDYRELIRRNPVHRRLMIGWVVIYATVGIQMGWTLRPFFGSPETETEFLRSGEWTNAFVVIGRIIWNVLAN